MTYEQEFEADFLVSMVRSKRKSYLRTDEKDSPTADRQFERAWVDCIEICHNAKINRPFAIQ